VAIKGKGRTRARRTIAAPPKPVPVVRRPPLWRRRWVQVTAGAMVLAGILAGVMVALNARAAAARRAREAAAVALFLNRVQAALPRDVERIPPDVVVIFPSVSRDLPKLGTRLEGETARRRGREIALQAARAAQALQRVSVTRTVPAEFGEDRATLADAQFLMVQAYQIYEQVGNLFGVAGSAAPPDRRVLVAQLDQLVVRSAGLFDRGYRKVLTLARPLGVPVSIPFQPPQVPTPTSAP
jgi:hypothetical protein